MGVLTLGTSSIGAIREQEKLRVLAGHSAGDYARLFIIDPLDPSLSTGMHVRRNGREYEGVWGDTGLACDNRLHVEASQFARVKDIDGAVHGKHTLTSIVRAARNMKITPQGAVRFSLLGVDDKDI